MCLYRADHVGDIVLSNVHFKLNFRVDRLRLRDKVNEQRAAFVASYEPLIRDVSVSLKYANNNPLPNGGAVYPRWNLMTNEWSTVEFGEAMRLVPHINIKPQGPRITSLRVFQSGSVIIVSRWPVEMTHVYTSFRDLMMVLRPVVVDKNQARQMTIDQCWGRI